MNADKTTIRHSVLDTESSGFQERLDSGLRTRKGHARQVLAALRRPWRHRNDD